MGHPCILYCSTMLRHGYLSPPYCHSEGRSLPLASPNKTSQISRDILRSSRFPPPSNASHSAIILTLSTFPPPPGSHSHLSYFKKTFFPEEKQGHGRPNQETHLSKKKVKGGGIIYIREQEHETDVLSVPIDRTKFNLLKEKSAHKPCLGTARYWRIRFDSERDTLCERISKRQKNPFFLLRISPTLAF